MEYWWIVRDYDIGGSWPSVVSDWHLTARIIPVCVHKSKVGPYWTRGEAARVVRLWKGFGG